MHRFGLRVNPFQCKLKSEGEKEKAQLKDFISSLLSASYRFKEGRWNYP